MWDSMWRPQLTPGKEGMVGRQLGWSHSLKGSDSGEVGWYVSVLSYACTVHSVTLGTLFSASALMSKDLAKEVAGNGLGWACPALTVGGKGNAARWGRTGLSMFSIPHGTMARDWSDQLANTRDFLSDNVALHLAAQRTWYTACSPFISWCSKATAEGCLQLYHPGCIASWPV